MSSADLRLLLTACGAMVRDLTRKPPAFGRQPLGVRGSYCGGLRTARSGRGEGASEGV